MKISTLVTVLICLGALFPPAPAAAQIAGTAVGNVGGGSAITPMQISPPNISRPSLTRPNISPAPAHHSGNVPVEHFQDSIISAQQSQQKAWEAKMLDRQKQTEQARKAAEAAQAAEAAKAAKIAPAAGDVAKQPEPDKPSIFIVGFAKLVNMLPHPHGKAADAP